MIKTIKAVLNGTTRFITGLVLGGTTLAGAFARASLGTVVNGLKTVAGVIGTVLALAAHTINFSVTYPFVTDVKSAPNVQFTKKY